MRRPTIALVALALSVAAPAARAEPCVSATFDSPLAGAVDVVTRRADVPSVQFPGLWQEGTLNGYFYALYANGEALLKASDWQVEIRCSAQSNDCERQVSGVPPKEAQQIASTLQRCLRGEKEPAPTPEPAPTSAPQVADPKCGVATVPDDTPGFVVQNLLVAAGADPGPVDGLVGPKTRGALVKVLGAKGGDLDVPDAITALDRHLCGAQN